MLGMKIQSLMRKLNKQKYTIEECKKLPHLNLKIKLILFQGTAISAALNKKGHIFKIFSIFQLMIFKTSRRLVIYRILPPLILNKKTLQIHLLRSLQESFLLMVLFFYLIYFFQDLGTLLIILFILMILDIQRSVSIQFQIKEQKLLNNITSH